MTAEQKQRARDKVAARQGRAKQRTDDSAMMPANGTEQAKAGSTAVAAISQEKLISEAEQKSRELSETFKLAMTESYP